MLLFLCELVPIFELHAATSFRCGPSSLDCLYYTISTRIHQDGVMHKETRIYLCIIYIFTMIDKDMLEAIGQLLEPIKQDLAEVKQRVTKIEVTQEQITNKNIQLLMEGQHDVNEKLKQLDAVSAAVEDIQITVNAMEAVTKQNCTDIKQLRLAK